MLAFPPRHEAHQEFAIVSVKRPLATLLLALALLAPACGGKASAGSNPDAGNPDAGNPDAGPTRRLTISSMATQLSEDGGSAGDVALTMVPTIQLDDGSTRAVTATSAGHWFADVPLGPAWVEVGSILYRVTGDAVDLGNLTTTRASAASPTRATPATLALNFPQTWVDGKDTLQLFSWGADSWDAFDPKLTTGVSTANVIEDWNAPTFGHGALNLLSSSDTLVVLQYRKDHDAANGVDYQRAIGYSSATNTAMNDGQASMPALPAMSSVAQTGRISTSWRTTQFEAAVPRFDYTGRHEVSIFAQGMQPGGEFTHAASPNLLDLPLPAGSPDRTLKALPYGQFLPSFYQELVYTEYYGFVLRTAPGGSGIYGFGLVVRRDALGALPSPLVPLVTAPRTLQIAGNDATVQQRGLGLAPKLSWSAPEAGAPTQFRVRVYEIPPGVSVDQPGWILQATLVLAGSASDVQLPAKLLLSGKSYVFGITASQGAGTAATPLRGQLPMGSADAFTEVYTP